MKIYTHYNKMYQMGYYISIVLPLLLSLLGLIAIPVPPAPPHKLFTYPTVLEGSVHLLG